MMRLVWLAVLTAFLSQPVWAIDPGTASGSYTRGAAPVALSHAIALRRDEEEMLFPNTPMRVLLSDRDVLLSDILSSAFPPVETSAKEGAVRGLILEFDPADRTKLLVRVLEKTDNPAESLATLTIERTEGVWKALTVSDTRITGTLDTGDEPGDLHISFSAPVFTNPVTEEIKGAAVQKSPFLALLTERIDAVAADDYARAAATMTAHRHAAVAATPPVIRAQLRQAVPAMRAEIATIDRIVVRGDVATGYIGQDQGPGFVRERGVWKLD